MSIYKFLFILFVIFITNLNAQNNDVFTSDSIESFLVNNRTYNFRKLEADARKYPKITLTFFPSYFYRKVNSGGLNFGAEFNLSYKRFNFFTHCKNSFFMDDHVNWASDAKSSNPLKSYSTISAVGSYFFKMKNEIESTYIPLIKKSTKRKETIYYASIKNRILKNIGVSFGISSYSGTFANFNPEGDKFNIVSNSGIIFPNYFKGGNVSITYNTGYQINIFRIGIVKETKRNVVLKKVGEKRGYRSLISNFQQYAHLIIPLKFNVDPLIIGDTIKGEYLSYNTSSNKNVVLLPGSYDIVHSEKDFKGGLYKNNQIGFCYGLKYYRLSSLKAIGNSFHLELGLKPSLFINEKYYLSGINRFPIYFEIGYGITFTSVK